MKVFADTSGLFALMVHNDYMHVRAKLNFEYFSLKKAQLLTSSFVLVETLALLQRRVGVDSVQDFSLKIFPLLDLLWIDEYWYSRAMQRLLIHKQKDVSLVDFLSFEIMEAQEISCVFTFDKHFEDHGFTIAAFHDLDKKRSF